MNAASLLQEIRALDDAIEAGEDVPSREIASVLARIHDCAESFERADIARLKDAIDHMHETARAQRDQLGQQLGKVASGRRAMRGYGRKLTTGAKVRVCRRA